MKSPFHNDTAASGLIASRQFRTGNREIAVTTWAEPYCEKKTPDETVTQASS